jgi:hypothetical protein
MFLRVGLQPWTTGAPENQTYGVTITEVPRPVECAPDVGEPDGTIATAATLAPGTSLSPIRCGDYDADTFKLVLPPLLGGTVSMSFDHARGDMRLDLLDENGTLLRSSNASSLTSGVERLDLPEDATAERTYYAQVRIHAQGTSATPQPYTVGFTQYDHSQCVATEPVGNDTFLEGTCVGNLPMTRDCLNTPLPVPLATTLASCGATPSAPGCGVTCGATDADFYRLGTLQNGRLVKVRLEHDPSKGALALELRRLNVSPLDNTSLIGTPWRDDDGDGVIELRFVAPSAPSPPREHAVAVVPVGTTGFSAALYALSVDIGPECVADVNEGGGNNNAPGRSTLLRSDPRTGVAFSQSVGATLCGDDVDVYEVFAFAGEVVTATLRNATDMTVNIGARPSNLSLEAPTVDGGAGVSQGNGTVIATVTNNQARQLFFTVKRTKDTAVGAYTLDLAIVGR